jgi:hypothetical protein
VVAAADALSGRAATLHRVRRRSPYHFFGIAGVLNFWIFWLRRRNGFGLTQANKENIILAWVKPKPLRRRSQKIQKFRTPAMPKKW